MLNNWYKKEKPFIGFAGFGGGATGLAFGGGAGNPIVASGGVISDYEDGGVKYRAHIFTNSGTFNISEAAGDAAIEYLVVGGGGGGGYTYQVYTAGGGGGAGGLRTNVPGVQDAAANPLTADPYPVSAGTYNVVVGNGGIQGCIDGTNGYNGGDSAFYPPSHSSYPAVQYIRGAGGGGGGNAAPNNTSPAIGRDGSEGGGSGGGTTSLCEPFGQAGGSAGTADPNHPKPAGNAGGNGPPGSANSYTLVVAEVLGSQVVMVEHQVEEIFHQLILLLEEVVLVFRLLLLDQQAASPVGTPGPSGTGWFAGGGGAGSYKNPSNNEGNGSAPGLVVDLRVGRKPVQGTELVIDIVTLDIIMLVFRALVVEEVELEPPIQVVLEMDLLDNLVL